MKNYKKESLQGIKWTTIDRWTNEIINFVVLIILARMLEPAVFGVVALGKAFILVLEQFYEMGFEVALIQIDILKEEHKNSAFWFNIVISAVIVITCILSAEYIANFYKEPVLQSVVIVLALSIISKSLSTVHLGLLRREFRFSKLAKRNIMATGISGVVGLSMALRGFEIWSLVGMYLTKSFVGMILLWYAAKWIPQFKFSIYYFRELFNFSVYLFFSRLVISIAKQGDKLLIGRFFAMEIVGIFKISHDIVRNIISVIGAILSQVALPIFSRMQKNEIKLFEIYITNIRMSLFATGPFLIILIIYPDIILDRLLGAQWLFGTSVLQVFAVSGFMLCINYFNDPIVLAKGYSKQKLYLAVVSSIITIGLIYLIIPYGIEAVAFAVLISSILNHIIFVILIKNKIYFKLGKHINNILIGLAPSIVMLAGVQFILFLNFRIIYLYHVIFSILFGFLLYMATIAVLDKRIFRFVLYNLKKLA